MTSRLWYAPLRLVLALVLACAPGVRYSPDLHFHTAPVSIVTATDTVTVLAELAVTPQQQEQGLMERERLAEDAGMLFRFAQRQPADFTFYMYRTHIPLDVAFIDEEGTILRIIAMEPCVESDADRCPRYQAGVQFRMALEVNRGFFARHGVAPGARVLVNWVQPAFP
jgi:uncharacterized protein